MRMVAVLGARMTPFSCRSGSGTSRRRTTCAVIELWSETLPLVERLKLLLGRIASCFVIPGIVGLLHGGVAPSLERLA